MFPPTEPSLPCPRAEEPSSSHSWLSAIQRQAQLNPERISVIGGEEQLSFSGLDQQSDRIALELQQRGIGEGRHVGVGLHRTPDLIVALLGILKSGAAYVPLDPDYPPARITRMITSAGLETVITSESLASCFPRAELLIPDKLPPAGNTASMPAPPARDPHARTYAIFTSGSTGLPKAASVFDSGFTNLLAWYARELNLGPSDRTLVISSPSFDLTQKNLFAPLMTGGTLVLDDGRTYDITRILGLIARHGITLINCTPSAFYPLVDAAAADGFKSLCTLRYAVLGGEPISAPRLRTWLEHPSCHTQVVNSYGPTECTDICLFHRLNRGNLDRFPFIPLGREIPNVQVTIRDENLAPLPDGETGELCIAGMGVGGGYLNDPERSAERFVNGIYRTGDLAKRHPCGTFEFRGRADHQVKVNGFRIEPGEIEIALNAHDKVSEAIVTAADGKLTAHVRGRAHAAELRAHLAASHPAYMIPSEFHFVDQFPLTPNGKVDRKALADMGPSASPSVPDSRGTHLESLILSLWSGILGHPITNPTANFFDVGGNSIHLAIVHVRLREMTGRDFPITDLFAHTSARSLASHFSPRPAAPPASSTHHRARLAQSGFARFQRPLAR